MAKRKNIRGAGRKPQGEFSELTASFTVRMPDSLREELEAAATRSGRSASQELLIRLNQSFGRGHDKDRDPDVRAICFLIADLLEAVRYPNASGWYGDPFLFRAFKIGVAKLLDALEPKGEIRTPPVMKIYAQELRERAAGQLYEKKHYEWADEVDRTWQSPKSVGVQAAKIVLSAFYGIGPDPRIGWRTLLSSDEHHDQHEQAKFGLKVAERTWYGMDKVRHALQLKKPKTTDSKMKRKPKS